MVEAQTIDRHLHLILQRVPAAIWATDRDLRVTYSIGRSPAHGGIDLQDILGKAAPELVGSDDRAHPVVARHIATLSGERQAFDHHFAGRWYHVLLEPLVGPRDDVIGCFGLAIDVTEQHSTRDRLAQSEARLLEAQRLAHVGSWEWDIRRNRVTWSDELHYIHGIEPGQFGGTYEAFLSHVHPGDVPHVQAVILDALRCGKPFGYSHRIIRPGGDVRMIQSRGDVVLDPRGNPVRMGGSCWDATELWLAKTGLERTVSLLQATLESTADGILVVDRGGKIVATNERFRSMWKIPRELADREDDDELLAYVLGQLCEPEEFYRRVRELYVRPEEEAFEVIQFRDGRVFERTSRPQRIGSEVVGRVWSFHDVTERERLQHNAEFLAHASRLLASLDVENALEGAAQLVIREFGAGCAVDLLHADGVHRVVSATRDGLRSIPPLDRAVFSGHAMVRSMGRRSNITVPLMPKGVFAGALTICSAEGKSFDEDDLGLADELAHRVTLALENAQLFHDSSTALRSRDELLSVAAHEIRGPLTALNLAVYSLGHDLHLPPHADRVLGVLERESRRLSRFVDELLDVGRIRGGTLHFEIEPVNLSEVVREVATRFENELAQTGSNLTITAPAAITGQWDRFRLEQVVSNLLANAIKFGRGRPISISVTGCEDRAFLIVKDEGIGIEPSMRDDIFDPFERAVSLRHYGGLGLGLYIVRSIVNGLGGSVKVESEPDVGSSFTVELPRARQS